MRTLALGVVALPVAVGILAGCLGDETLDCRDLRSLRLEPDGHPDGKPFQVPLGAKVTAALAFDGAHPPPTYRWHLVADRGWGGGFPPVSFWSQNATESFALPYVGHYEIAVDFGSLDTRACSRDFEMPAGATFNPYAPTVRVEVVHVERATLPSDGSTYRYPFRTFCCIGVTISAAPTGTGTAAVEWTKAMVVERTGEVLWEGRDVCVPGDVWAPLGDSWLESIVIELRPSAAAPFPAAVRREYAVEIGLGSLDSPGSGYC